MGCCKPSKLLSQSYELCCSGKGQVDEGSSEFFHEENLLQDWENQIMFNTLNTKNLTEELLSSCNSEVVSLQLLQAILQNVGYRGSASFNFYRFSQGSGYSFLKIYLSAVLLGIGSNEEKLVCLFSLLDPSGRGYAVREEFSKMISEIICLSLCEHLEQVNGFPYLDSLKSAKSYTISKLTSSLCLEEKFTLPLLNARFADKYLWFMLSSRDLRGWMLSQLPHLRSPSAHLLQENPFQSEGTNKSPIRYVVSEEDTAIPKQQKALSDSIISIASRLSDRLPSLVEEEILSSSSDSEGPIQIKIQISPTGFGVFSWYPGEDPVGKAEDFALHNSLSEKYRDILISAIKKLKKNLE